MTYRHQLLMVSLLATLMTMSSADLQYNFYDSSCQNAETTIRGVVHAMIDANPSVAAALIRLYFHDCFVLGCDASILLDPTSANGSPEKSAIPLAEAGYKAVDEIKAAVEAECSGKVSCADIIALAARDAVLKSAGFYYNVPTGRRDGNASTAISVLTNMPSPFWGIDNLVASFARKKLSVDDLVALSGAHAIGVARCSGFTNRLYPNVDPAMDGSYAANLKITCPAPPGRGVPDNLVNNSAVPSTAFDNQFFKNAIARRVLFTSDAALMTRADTAAKVAENANGLTTWKVRFAASMIKMGNIEVLTGAQGQIRKSCRVVNS